MTTPSPGAGASVTTTSAIPREEPRVGELPLGYRETLPEAERHARRIVVAAEPAIRQVLLDCLTTSTHAPWYAVSVATNAEEVIRLLSSESAEVCLLDEWANRLLGTLPNGQRQRIQRLTVLITELDAPGIDALTCFATLGRSRVTRYSLDHMVWQAIRHTDVPGSRPAAPAVFDVLKSLARLGQTDAGDLTTSLRPLTEAGAKLLGVDRVSIWRLEDGPKRLTCLDMYDRQPGVHANGMTNPASNLPAYLMALENHRILPMDNAQQDPRCAELLPYLTQAGIGALLDAPIYLDGKVVGLLCHAHFGAPRQWTEQEQTIAANLADYVQILYMAHQRQQAEKALRVNQLALAQAQKMEALGRLSSGIAHDFNNLLMVISGNAQLSERKAQRSLPPDPRHLRNIVEACSRAESLARKLLTLGRHNPDTPHWLELNQLVSEVAHLLGPGLGAGIALHVATGAPAWVHADNDDLQNALINLATNARDAMPNGGELRLTVEPADPALLPRELDAGLGPFTRLTVRDTGTGMTPEVQARAMEPFFTTKGPDKGTGLGLWNVYNCLRSHHGHMTIVSSPGVGTAIHLYLPTIAVAPATPHAAPPIHTAHPHTGRVLLIEDDEAVHRIIADMLGFLGHQVTIFANGASAVERFRADPSAFDLVLLDFGMPGMSGSECLRTLRTIDPACRCLVMSGNITDQVAQDCRHDGALGILLKPFSLSDCAQAVEKALGTVALPAG